MRSASTITLSLLTVSGLVLAQTAPSQGGQTWKRVGDSGSGPAAVADPAGPPQAIDPPPAQLTVKAGTFVTVRINQALSSDKNQPGDAFTATLVRPVVVDGFVVAQPGQTLAGRVAEAVKAGRAKGVSHLGIQLTELTFADGQQAPIQSELVTRTGSTSEGRDAAAIGTTTGVGAAIGAAAAGGPGAAIGAGAGAVASTIGVLLTRGNPTIIRPEQVLTFRINSDIVVATDRAPQAFHPVGPADYNQPQLQVSRPGGYAPPAAAPGYAVGYPYVYGYPYGYGYPYYWGPSVGVYFGGYGRYGGYRHFR